MELDDEIEYAEVYPISKLRCEVCNAFVRLGKTVPRCDIHMAIPKKLRGDRCETWMTTRVMPPRKRRQT